MAIRLLSDELARRFTAPQALQNLHTRQLFVLRSDCNGFFQPLTDAATWIICHSENLTCFGWSDTANPYDYHDPRRCVILNYLPDTLQLGHWNGYILSSAIFGVVNRSRKSLRAMRVGDVIWDGGESERICLPHVTHLHIKSTSHLTAILKTWNMPSLTHLDFPRFFIDRPLFRILESVNLTLISLRFWMPYSEQ
ncbi:hypothetical protein BD410DRAFT_794766, partial [Rickenella mellea]